MVFTLHRYILRELGKTFVLTAIALTMMFTMGGGLLNLLRIEQISPADVARLFLYFIPFVASFMLPIAALLSCALVYGRLAADNELDACKASGINILRLMASAVGLALVVGAASFYLSNFKVPELFKQINEFKDAAQRSLPDMIVARLKEQGHVQIKNYVVYADNARKLDPQEAAAILHEQNPSKVAILLERGVFVEFKDEDPVQTGTAGRVLLVVDRSQPPGRLIVKLLDVHEFNHNPPRFVTLKDQGAVYSLGDLPTSRRLNLKYHDLWDLFRYQRNPAQTDVLKGRLDDFRQKLAGLTLVDRLVATLAQHGQAVFTGQGTELRVRLKGECRSDVEERHAQVSMRGQIQVDATTSGRTRTGFARNADLSIQPSRDGMAVSISLRDGVKLLDPAQSREAIPQAGSYDGMPTVTIPMASLPAGSTYTDEQILDRDIVLPIPRLLQEERTRLAANEQNILREITAAIHSRLAMSVSTIILVMLATGLGIVLRGGHALTAFGVSFIPTIIVVLMITTGRQLGEQAGTAILGLALMWGILALVAVLDGVVIFGFVKR